MTLEDLRVYVAVCEARTLTSVARALGCTQPAVAQHVARIEREVGVPLLERGPRGVAPTAAGRVLYEASSAGLGGLALALQEIERLRAGRGGRLAIATGGTTVRHFMSEAVREVRRRFPDVPIRFTPANSTGHCYDVLAQRRADLAFVTIGEPVRGFEQRLALELPLVLLVAREDPLAKRRRISVADLDGLRCITLTESTLSHRLIGDILERQRVRLESNLRVDDHDTARVFVELGLGHSIVPIVHAKHFEAEGRVRALPIAGLPPIAVGWAARSFALLPPAALAFMELVGESASRWKRHGVKVAR
ncbi:MAG TPA: LysR family transcriptional regulator [Candidatus Binatia bacterium]|nr:LysR family transcriptional regulator [Candidatus Binatia bacterium]